MNRRWIRIDRAHPSFDCSLDDFEKVLCEARSEFESFESSPPVLPTDESTDCSLTEKDFQLLEAINAELALLANLQRRENMLRADREQTELDCENAMHGKQLADLHAATLDRRKP